MSVRAKPMQIFCKFIGVAPYSFDSRSSKIKFRTSLWGTMYSIFIGILLTSFAIFNYKTINSNLTSGSHVTIGAQWLQFYVNNGFSVLIITANSLQQWKIVKVFNTIFDTKNQPEKILDHGETKKDIFYGMIVVVMTIFFNLLTMLTSYFDNEKTIDYYWFPYGILFLLNTLVILQFSYGVVMVGIKFKALNLRLEDFISKRQMIMTMYNNTKIIDTELNKVATKHSELVDTTNLLISAFSYQLLLCFVAALMISVSGLYLICKRTIQYIIVTSKLLAHDNRERNYDWWCLTCYPLSHSILLGSVIGVCHWTMNQITLVNGILPRIQRVFHLSGNSCIISTVLTYMIILVQFEISQDIQNTEEKDALNSVFSEYSYDDVQV